jgi:Bacteriocin-protection, YdeI or OmpD-Associated/Domain of unknown function (DUF1905)
VVWQPVTVRFRTELLQSSKTATGMVVPDEVMAALAAGKAPKVSVTINGFTYRSSVATVNGRPMIGVSDAVRQSTGVKGGDLIDVDVELDTAPRTVAVPDDLAAALDAEPAARATYDKLSYSLQRFWVEPIEGAKSPETRQRRIDKAIATLREGRSR